MKTYGLRREEVWSGDYALNACGYKGNQSRKVAVRRKKDKKLLHRYARRTNRIEHVS